MGLDGIKLEAEIHRLGTEILSELDDHSRRSFHDTHFFTEKFLSWGMQDEQLKINLFRFVDVLPSLPDSAAVIRHAQEYFGPLKGIIPDLLLKAMEIEPTSITSKIAAAAIRKQVSFVAKHFIAGETPKAALKPLRKLRRNGQAFTVDLLGEATVSEAEAAVYLDRYLEVLTVLAKEAPGWPEAAPIVPGHVGESTPINISVKLSALYSQARPLNTERSQQIFAERLAQILSAAKNCGAFVYVDMEDCSLTSITLQAFKLVLGMPEFRDYPRCGIVLQAYLRRTADDLRELLSWTQARGVPIGVRLVKGAYWDTETILAKQHHWEIPVWQHKSSSDANYEQLSLFLLENCNHLLPAFGSHNVRSLLHATTAAELLGVPKTAFELQTLYGMGEPIARAFAARGFLVRNYSPVGELIPGMGYLVRRLLENTSNEGFLRQSMHEHRSAESLLKKPLFVPGDTGTEHLNGDIVDEFFNTPLRDFTIPGERQRILHAIFQQKADRPKGPVSTFPIVNGKPLSSERSLSSITPEDPKRILADVALASADQTREALASLADFFPSWRDTPVEKRAEVLFRTADLLESRRPELTAAVILEAGKPWADADADVAEAIDFLHYYALEAKRLFIPRKMGRVPGEDNTYFYEPRGIAAIISPWNFPLAIPCGMFAAAIVTGNTAVLKPAEQTSLTASLLFQSFLDAGLPPRAAAFLPGIGEEIGPVLVQHPRVATVVFTGSKDVGLLLVRQGAESTRGAEHVKRIIAEMGGKNAIIVDDDADLDEAVRGIITSAFGYQGQKCSACSRAIVVGDNYERVAERLVEATRSIDIGPPSDPSALLGPVIDEQAYRRIMDIIEEAKNDCRLLVQGDQRLPQAAELGYYVPPTIFADIPRDHPLLRVEVFGPVLALQRAKTFEEALELANASEYGLTGAVFSRSPNNIARAAQEFRTGNLYINRGSTGALVMRQPFGGAKMSGVGSKAGGPDYLLQFVIPRSITENTMRRGFAPSI